MAAYIDQLRKDLGVDFVNAQIRRGMRGEPVFYCTENGHEVGTKVFAKESPTATASGVDKADAKNARKHGSSSA